MLWKGSKIKWCKPTIYINPLLTEPNNNDCNHTKSNKTLKQGGHSKILTRSINTLDLNLESTPFIYDPEQHLPGLHEKLEDPDSVDIDTLDFGLDDEFKHLDSNIRSLLRQFSKLHPAHKTDTFPDIGQF